MAQWSTSSTVNNTVSTGTGDQMNSKIIWDLNGGAILTWQDRASGFNDVYARRVDAGGTVLWTVTVCGAGGDQSNPVIVGDGNGGAFIAWDDYRNGLTGDIYAQRLNASGVAQWTADGVVVNNSTNDQAQPTIVAGPSPNTATIFWRDLRNGTDYDLYAQSVNGSGSTFWLAAGVAVGTGTGNQILPQAVSVGSGETIVTWEDARNGTSNTDIYAQKLDASGSALWTANGVVVSSATGNQSKPSIGLGLGDSGSVIAWHDGNDIFAQRLNGSGVAQWTANGVTICSAADAQINPVILKNSSTSAFIAWQDNRSGTNYDIYAQKVNSSGVVQLTTNGVAVSTASGDQTNPVMAIDASGGAVVAWDDFRSGSNLDVYAQRFNSSGAMQWTTNGVAVSTAANEQSGVSVAYVNNNQSDEGFIFTWNKDHRNSSYDVYLQRVNINGVLCGKPGNPGAITGNQTINAGSVNSYSVTTVPGADSYNWYLPSGWTGTSTTNSISTTASGTSGNVTVEATNTCGANFQPSNLAITVNKLNQTITFNALATKLYSDGTFALTATASSSLSVSYTSSNTSVATVSGSTVTIVGVGTSTITAKQAGNAIYNAASDVTQLLTVNKGNQVITFTIAVPRTVGDAPLTMNGSSTSGLSITYSSSNTAVATVSGAVLTFVSAGSVTITASQSGDANYNAATAVTQTFCVNPPKPTVTITGLNTETPLLTSSAANGNQWFLNNAAIASAVNTTYTVAAAGVYKVQVTLGGCSSAFSDNTTLVITGDLSMDNSRQGIILYPNPVSDKLTVLLPQTPENKLVTIHQPNGSVADSKETISHEVSFDISSYASGIYLVKVDAGKSTHVVRFIKK